MRSLLAPAAAPALLLTLLLAAPVHAESAAAAPQWDHRHMQSNFANRLGASAPIVIVGSNRFAAEEATPPTGVREQVLQLNPHGWKPGGARAGGSASGPLDRPASADFSSTRGARAQRESGLRRVSR
jgi:hypothetical protein